MVALDVSHLLTLAVGAGLAGVGFLFKRLMTGARQQEHVAHFASLTDIASKMKATGISTADIAVVESFLRGKHRERTLLAEPQMEPAVLESEGHEPDGYWTQAAMNMRAAATLKTAEAQLNEAVLELSHYYGEKVWPLHKAWEEFRNGQATMMGNHEGGSLAPLLWASEALSLTRQRLAWANAQLEEFRLDDR